MSAEKLAQGAPTYILGLNATYHDLAACLLRDGVLLAAVEEERFSRIKHGKRARIDNADALPMAAIEYCLRMAGISLAEVFRIGYSFVPKLRLKNIGAEPYVAEASWGSDAGEQAFVERLSGVPGKLSELLGTDVRDRFVWLPHHICHAASAYLPSPFAESAVLSIDGIGEFATTWLGHGVGRHLKGCKELDYPHSLGFLWEKLAQFLGFTEYDASKIMGLASYGDHRRFYPRLRSLVSLDRPGEFALSSDILRFRSADFAPLEALLLTRCRTRGQELQPVHQDLAAALQKLTDEVVLHLGSYLSAATGSRRLCLAGGVALNCVANYALWKSGLFDEIYVQPAANDAGTALGAALFLWTSGLAKERGFVMEHPFFGPEFSPEELERALGASGLRYQRLDSIAAVAAKLLSDGRIVGWFDGRVEWGPRALGHRSLLADPRRPDMQDTLNRRIKHREPFRPFAPSVLSEHAAEWFELPEQCRSISTEFMNFTFPVRSTHKGRVPAITHVDGTSRIQVVDHRRNPRYHALIRAFYEGTGVPMLLNTSFNENEPIVCTPEDAIRTFTRTRMDALVLGDFLILKGECAAVQ
jgi:carbamoyltransferase